VIRVSLLSKATNCHLISYDFVLYLDSRDKTEIISHTKNRLVFNYIWKLRRLTNSHFGASESS